MSFWRKAWGALENSKITKCHAYTQTHRHTDTQTHRHTDTQTHTQPYMHAVLNASLPSTYRRTCCMGHRFRGHMDLFLGLNQPLAFSIASILAFKSRSVSSTAVKGEASTTNVRDSSHDLLAEGPASAHSERACETPHGP